ncbi:hypothetical protein BC938DRAFT_470680 [Jimgerdemannia flammicorona]|uniref:Uncharacterized protein n=1 Tax=Jimgerdemannia flammicorona TaxID=994334 RepID=A0A433Q9P0_9FUNG|nr:hypothetical protein BC938DRAFT_470680 [Jimgerdemannia flammicorona]
MLARDPRNNDRGLGSFSIPGRKLNASSCPWSTTMWTVLVPRRGRRDVVCVPSEATVFSTGGRSGCRVVDGRDGMCVRRFVVVLLRNTSSISPPSSSSSSSSPPSSPLIVRLLSACTQSSFVLASKLHCTASSLRLGRASPSSGIRGGAWYDHDGMSSSGGGGPADFQV